MSVASAELRAEFEACVVQSRAALHAYCYRMLGSVQDAEDALQDALLSAHAGLGGFAGTGTLRSWLYQIATRACLRLIEARPKRWLARDYAPSTQGVELSPMIEEPIWLEPYPLDAQVSIEQRQSVELAFIAGLQALPATQRAVLILRTVLEFDAAETAGILDVSVAAVNSALQRARATLSGIVPETTQQMTLRDLGDARTRELVASFVRAWGNSDVEAIVALLVDDARFSMPPFPNWFFGKASIARFLAERIFEYQWRLVPTEASGQLAFVCFQGPAFEIGAFCVLSLRGGLIAEMTGFLDRQVFSHFRLAERFSLPER